MAGEHLILAAFSGGLWNPEGREFGIPADALLIADNVEFLQSGGLIGRRGRSKLNSVALGGMVNSLWRYYSRPSFSVPSTLAAVTDGSNSDFFHASSTGGEGTFTAVSGGANVPGTEFFFTTWPSKSNTYLASLTSGLRRYSGPAGTIAAVVADAGNQVALTSLGPYLKVHKSRLYATHVNELSFSVYATEVNFDNKVLAVSQLNISDSQGGVITGLESYLDFLLIFKTSGVSRFIGDISTTLNAQLNISYTDVGCVARNSIAFTPHGVIYVGRQGVYITDGMDPNPPELSLPIRPVFVSRTSQTQYSDAIGRWYPNKQQYVLKLDPTANDAYVLHRIEILAENKFTDTRSRVVWVWSHHTNLPARSMAVWESETDDGRLISGGSDGFIHIYDGGTTDDGTAIGTTVQTASIPIDTLRRGRSRTGRVRYVKLLHRASTVLSGECLYDQAVPGGGAPFLVGDTTLAEKFSRAPIADRALDGRFVSVWLNNPASNAQFEVHMLDLETRLRAMRVWRDDTEQLASTMVEDQGNVVISGTATEAVVTFATAQVNTNYEVAFGLYPSAGIGPTTVGIKPGTKATTGFTAVVGGAPGSGNQYTIMWVLARA